MKSRRREWTLRSGGRLKGRREYATVSRRESLRLGSLLVVVNLKFSSKGVNTKRGGRGEYGRIASDQRANVTGRH